jgi:hypothetical protein
VNQNCGGQGLVKTGDVQVGSTSRIYGGYRIGTSHQVDFLTSVRLVWMNFASWSGG